MDILLLPLSMMGIVLITAPFVAIIIAFIFAGLYLKTNLKTNLFTSVFWGIYTLYEYAMKLRILCSGECNIRVDLLVLYPLLIFVSILAIIKTIRWFKNGKR